MTAVTAVIGLSLLTVLTIALCRGAALGDQPEPALNTEENEPS